MKSFEELAASIVFSEENGITKLCKYDSSLALIGEGRSAVVFRIHHTNFALKVFFPSLIHIAKEEAEIYQKLQLSSYFPRLHGAGNNYIVIDYIEGTTLFDCLRLGVKVRPEHIKEIDDALRQAREFGLNPSDIHLKNIMVTNQGEIKLIDVARFRQVKNCSQWDDIKLAYFKFYQRSFFPKKIPLSFLNMISKVYKNEKIQRWITNFHP
ncbi:protein kinase family protein [Bacillus sp. AK128]